MTGVISLRSSSGRTVGFVFLGNDDGSFRMKESMNECFIMKAGCSLARKTLPWILELVSAEEIACCL